ncbi:MAG TPA: hypothetical protein VJ697_02970 [Nitrososphaeraceae archaeon]|nr:hypothetical protein [Nitrososphaeraceae archaeon]
MSLKDKLVNTIASHPRLVTFGIGLAVTFVIGTIIGMINDPTHTASAFSHQNQENSGNNGCC